MNYTLFLDMDGVLVDFVGGALKHHGKKLPRNKVQWDFHHQIGFKANPDAFWEPLDEEFWANLPWTKEGKDLLLRAQCVFGESIVVVTIPKDDRCRRGKERWVERHMPQYRDRLIFCKDKSILAAPTIYLIDDRNENVDAFNDAGGRASLFPRPWNRANHLCDGKGDCRWDLFHGATPMEYFPADWPIPYLQDILATV